MPLRRSITADFSRDATGGLWADFKHSLVIVIGLRVRICNARREDTGRASDPKYPHISMTYGRWPRSASINLAVPTMLAVGVHRNARGVSLRAHETSRQQSASCFSIRVLVSRPRRFCKTLYRGHVMRAELGMYKVCTLRIT